MSHTVATALKRGWVELRPNPEDGRSKRVWLTERGRAFREEAIASLAPDLAAILDAAEPGLMQQLLPRLEALRKDLDARRSG
jgi:DNA-binding MarR family transcriptional regulator